MTTSSKSHPVYLLSLICLLSITSVMSEMKGIVKGNERFGKNLFKTLSSDYENLIMSPLSAHSALSMAYAGADGSTADAFRNVLGVKDGVTAAHEYQELMKKIKSASDTVTLKLANKIFIQNDFKVNPDFTGLLKTNYFSDAQNLNFAEKDESASVINTWVEDQTNHKIKDLISPDMLDELTRLVLVNAIYFKGKWAKQFNKDSTRKEKFYLLDGSDQMVDMMHISDKFNYAENADLDCKILELPYKNSDISMVIFLPNERNGIKNLEKKITNFDFSTYDRAMSKIEVDVSLPKFKIESTIPLKATLSKMGLDVIFSDNADFSKMTLSGQSELKVSDVIQKAFIEVNEEGAEAAAATVVRIRKRCINIEPEKKIFVVDKPFFYMLVGNDNNVLFIGKMTTVDATTITHEEL